MLAEEASRQTFPKAYNTLTCDASPPMKQAADLPPTQTPAPCRLIVPVHLIKMQHLLPSSFPALYNSSQPTMPRQPGKLLYSYQLTTCNKRELVPASGLQMTNPG